MYGSRHEDGSGSSMSTSAPFGVAVLAVLLQVLTRTGVQQPFLYDFGAAVALAAVSLAPIALIGRSGSPAAPAPPGSCPAS
ncbi:hypothetical protein ABGB18_13280 [Nonomuraea sp. B12E4]|uniref:hypothetical protein n=1 Tax=Nonomuraea sp. B12E4 TaxID=3153564 RepID=UPI00325E44CA